MHKNNRYAQKNSIIPINNRYTYMRDILLQILLFLKFHICLKISVRRYLKMTNEQTRGEGKGGKKFLHNWNYKHIQYQDVHKNNRYVQK